MRFMLLYKAGKEATDPPTPDVLADVAKLTQEWARGGVLLSTDGLQPSSKGARVRISGGKLTVSPGPFSEESPVIAGYAIVQTTSKDDAIELAKRFLKVMGEGESEVRQMLDAPPNRPRGRGLRDRRDRLLGRSFESPIRR